jgi:phage gp36-like protein
MAYITQGDLLGKLPMAHLVDAVDDDKDGTPDEAVLAKVLSDASDEVDSYLERIYSVPIAAPVPKLVTQAALYFALLQLCKRRGIAAEAFPWKSELEAKVRVLERIQAGEESLAGQTATAPGAAITSDMATEESTL